QDVNHKVLDELLEDPEVESYQFVMKSVRDNGTHALKELSRRVSDLTDHMHEEEVRRALFRKDLHDAEAVATLQEYVEALEGHVSGLEHNIEVLTTALTESDQRYRSVLNSRV